MADSLSSAFAAAERHTLLTRREALLAGCPSRLWNGSGPVDEWASEQAPVDIPLLQSLCQPHFRKCQPMERRGVSGIVAELFGESGCRLDECGGDAWGDPLVRRG